MQLDNRGRPIEDQEIDLGENVLIVDPTQHQTNIQRARRPETRSDADANDSMVRF